MTTTNHNFRGFFFMIIQIINRIKFAHLNDRYGLRSFWCVQLFVFHCFFRFFFFFFSFFFWYHSPKIRFGLIMIFALHFLRKMCAVFNFVYFNFNLFTYCVQPGRSYQHQQPNLEAFCAKCIACNKDKTRQDRRRKNAQTKYYKNEMNCNGIRFIGVI